jgi:hypothetical protein
MCGPYFMQIINSSKLHLSQPISNQLIFLIFFLLKFDRDVNVQLYEEWLVERDTHNDTIALSTLFKYLEESKPMRNSVSNRPAITSKYVRKKHKNQVSVGAEVM